MMYGYGSGMGAIWALVIFAIVLPSLLLATALIMGDFRRPPQERHSRSTPEAERLLADRFARGEIDFEEYERLTGTVSWSNQETRLIAFQEDGEPRDAKGDQTFYNVIADDLNFPSCLVGSADDPVRQDQRRVELEAIHQDFGEQQQVHFAVSVRCLE